MPKIKHLSVLMISLVIIPLNFFAIPVKAQTQAELDKLSVQLQEDVSNHNWNSAINVVDTIISILPSTASEQRIKLENYRLNLQNNANIEILNVELKQAVSIQDWKTALNVVNQMINFIPATDYNQRQKLKNYQLKFQSLYNATATPTTSNQVIAGYLIHDGEGGDYTYELWSTSANYIQYFLKVWRREQNQNSRPLAIAGTFESTREALIYFDCHYANKHLSFCHGN